MLTLEFYGVILGVVGSAMVLVYFAQVPWLPTPLFSFGYHPNATRQICAAVAAAVANRRDLIDALEGIQVHQPELYRSRLGRAIASLREDPSALVTALGEAKVLPPGLIADLRAADAIGGHSLQRCFQRVGDADGASTEGLRRQLAVTLPYLIALVSVQWFIAVFILPKFERIFDELGIRLPVEFELALSVVKPIGELWYLGVLLLFLILFCMISAVWLWHRFEPFARRLRRGELLRWGLSEGRSEGELATALSVSWRQPPPALARAGAKGDLAALAAVCGWRASTPEALVAAVERARARMRWLATIMGGGLRVVLPVVLSLPVYILALGIFKALYSIIGMLEGMDG